MPIYKMHLQKIERGKPAFEVTFTVMVNDAPDVERDGSGVVEHISEGEDDHDIVVSDATTSYSVTVRLDHSRDQSNVGARNITFSDGCAVARSL